MASAQITLASTQLQQLLSLPSYGMRLLVEQAVNKILQGEMSEHLRAEHGERTGERQGCRNGFYARRMTTRGGRIELEFPRDRDGTLRTELFDRFQRSEKALVLTLMDMVVHGWRRVRWPISRAT
jgi:transposase-like protein